MTHAFLQMVSLYRDPEGEYVFNTAGNTLNTNEMNLNLVSGEVTTQMREKIVELESLLEKSQVSYGMMCIDGECLRQSYSYMQNGRTLTCSTCHPDDQPITIDTHISSSPADTGCSIIVLNTEEIEEFNHC